MSGKEQKKLEKYYFDEFMKCYTMPYGDITHDDKPDFVIKSENTIGIEITNFYISEGGKTNSEQEQKSIREDILRTAKEKFKEESNTNIQLAISFCRKLRPNDVPRIANEISALALKLLDHDDEIVNETYFEHIREIDFISFNNRGESDSEWQTIQSHNIKLLNQFRLEEIIKNKSSKISNYVKCNEYWLLIIIDYFDPAQDQSLPISIELKNIEHGYAKIFIFKPQTHEYKEVLTNTLVP